MSASDAVAREVSWVAGTFPAADRMHHPSPAPAQLEQLLDHYAPFRAIPLVPEVSAFYGHSLIEVWEAAEQIAGGPLPAPFWAYPWAAGTGLARVILDHSEWFAGQRVLDFGCGGGVAALAAARCGAMNVVANDVDEWALMTVRLAAARQGLLVQTLHADLTARAADWPACDIVLCSDLAYEKRMAPKQRAVLDRARRNGARVFVADAGRKYFDPAGMTLIAEYTINVPRDLEGVEIRVAKVYEMGGTMPLVDEDDADRRAKMTRPAIVKHRHQVQTDPTESLNRCDARLDSHEGSG